MEAEQLLRILRSEIEKLTLGEDEVAVAFSGGLDSSVVAAIASGFVSVEAYTCAVSGSHDARNAAGCAAREKLSFHLELISDIDLVRLVGEAVRISSSENPVKAAYTVPIVCVIERSRQKTILTGSGADELFGGYAKYVSAEEPGAMMAADLEKIVAETSLLSEFALRRGKRLCSPFLSDAIVEFSRMIGPEQKISGADRKTVLRAASKMLGLESYGTPKKAAQYSSGVLKRMQRLAKAEGLAMDEWVAKTTRS